MKYLVRLIVLPYLAAMSLIGLLVMWVKYMKNFILYGGEFITYTRDKETKTIQDIYNKLTNDHEV